MRNPLRDEGAAFQVVLLTLAACALIVLASWVSTWLGVAVSVLILLASAAAVRRGLAARSRARPVSQGSSTLPPGRTRILVVLSADGGDDDELIARACSGAAGGAAFVVVPVLDNAARAWSARREQAVADGERRLSAAAARLRAEGLDVDGRLGTVDVEQAFEEVVRSFGPTVAIVTGRLDAAASARIADRLGVERS